MLEPTELVLAPSGISFVLGGRFAFAFDRISRIMLWAWYQWEAWTITDNGHKNDQMCSKRGERQTFWDILNAGYEYQLPVMRQMALFISMTNISRKRFGPQGENTKQNDVIKWKHFPRNESSVRGIHKGNHRSPVESSHKGQWRGALCSLRFAPEQTVEQTMGTQVRRHHAHYGVTVIFSVFFYRSLLNTLRAKWCDRQHHFS